MAAASDVPARAATDRAAAEDIFQGGQRSLQAAKTLVAFMKTVTQGAMLCLGQLVAGAEATARVSSLRIDAHLSPWHGAVHPAGELPILKYPEDMLAGSFHC